MKFNPNWMKLHATYLKKFLLQIKLAANIVPMTNQKTVASKATPSRPPSCAAVQTT
jgi:hypothetical protein